MPFAILRPAAITAGQLQALDATAGVPAGAILCGGWAFSSASKPYVQDLAGSAVPAGSKFIGKIAFHPDGRMYVTTDAPASPVVDGGVGIRTDGAVYTSATAVNPGDVYLGGLAVAQTGAVRASIV